VKFKRLSVYFPFTAWKNPFAYVDPLNRLTC
jgi:hypothetical protein